MQIGLLVRLWKILISPRSQFEQFRDGIPIVLPLLCVLFSGAIYVGVTAYYTDGHTYKGHLQDHASIQEEIDILSEEILERLRQDTDESQGISKARRNTTFLAPVAYAITFSIGLALLASYYWLVSFSYEERIGWGRWFGFVCWASTPTIYGSVFSVVLIVLFGIEWKNSVAPLTWIGWTQPWAVLFTIPLVWIVFISIQGLRCWGSTRLGPSVIVVLVPYLVYVLIGSFFMGIPAIVS